MNPEDNCLSFRKTSIILFIDSIDQLSSDDGAYMMQWLPTKLGKNVKVIISTLTNEGYPVYTNLSKVAMFLYIFYLFQAVVRLRQQIKRHFESWSNEIFQFSSYMHEKEAS